MKKILFCLIALIVALSLILAVCSSNSTYVEQPVTSTPTVAVEETYGPPAPVVTAEPTEIPGPEGSLG